MCSERASCHKHHMPTQSLTHPAPFHPPPPSHASKAIRSHRKSETRKPLQVLGEAGDLKQTPMSNSNFPTNFHGKLGRHSRATCGALSTHCRRTLCAPLGRALAEALFLRETEPRSPPGRSLRALSSARLLGLSSLKTFKYFFFCITQVVSRFKSIGF